MARSTTCFSTPPKSRTNAIVRGCSGMPMPRDRVRSSHGFEPACRWTSTPSRSATAAARASDRFRSSTSSRSGVSPRSTRRRRGRSASRTGLPPRRTRCARWSIGCGPRGGLPSGCCPISRARCALTSSAWRSRPRRVMPTTCRRDTAASARRRCRCTRRSTRSARSSKTHRSARSATT